MRAIHQALRLLNRESEPRLSGVGNRFVKLAHSPFCNTRRERFETTGDDRKISPFRIAPRGGHNEVAPRRREENLALCRGQKSEQRGSSLRVELARHIVQQQEWIELTSPSDACQLRALQRQGDRSVLPLRRDHPSRMAVDAERKVVTMRTEPGALALRVAMAPRIRQLASACLDVVVALADRKPR